MRSIAIIAVVAVIGFSMAGCSPEDKEEPYTPEPLPKFPDAFFGGPAEDEASRSWVKSDPSVEIEFGGGGGIYHYMLYSSRNRLIAVDGNTYTIEQGGSGNSFKNLRFTATVDTDSKLTISNAALIGDGSPILTEEKVNNLNGVYTIKEN